MLREVYSSLPPLPWTAAAAMVLLGVAEALSGRNLRARIRGGPGLKPVAPLAALLETDTVPQGAPGVADLTGMLAFLDRLRNAGLRPRKMGDFRHPNRTARAPILKDA